MGFNFFKKLTHISCDYNKMTSKLSFFAFGPDPPINFFSEKGSKLAATEGHRPTDYKGEGCPSRHLK